MDNLTDRIKALQEKLDQLLQRQEAFSEEITQLRNAISALQEESLVEEVTPAAPEPPVEAQPEPQLAEEFPEPETTKVAKVDTTEENRSLFLQHPNKILAGVCSGIAYYSGMNVWLVRVIWILFSLLFCIGALAYLILWAALPNFPKSTRDEEKVLPPTREQPSSIPVPADAKTGSKPGFNLEKYIGESLISKIGMVVLIIGAAIGVKYSIENDLISPTVRIILGYMLGVLLLFIGIRLKRKYETFSAILVSGAMAILYFMTFAAYLFYGMLTQWMAFALMVIFTVVTVFIALWYNRQIIAHLGMVGAYSIPFLLDDGQGDPLVLLSYVAIINLGILFIAFRKYWKPLYVVSFVMTWLIYLTWFAAGF